MKCLILILISINAMATEVKLPPMPGPKNELTVEGIDKNKNNVRDDVEIYIFREMQKTDPQLYKAYLRYAETLQIKLKNRFNRDELLRLSDIEDNDLLCICAMENEEKLKVELVSGLIKKTFNTDLRLDALAQETKTIKSISVKDLPSRMQWKGLCRFKLK